MSSRDISFHTKILQERAKYLRYFHVLNPTKQLEGPNLTTSSSTLVEMKSYIGPIPNTSPTEIPIDTINANGIPLSSISGLPADLYPGVNAYHTNTYPYGQFIIQHTPEYSVPSGFTFLSNWFWERYNPSYCTVSTTTTSNDTITAILHQYNGTAYGNIPIVPGTRIMFSVIHSVWSGSADFDGIGVGTLNATVNDYVGVDTHAIGIYDDGIIYTNNDTISASPLAIFEINGQVIDVAVDTIVNKMWYRVDGGAWQG